MLPSWSYLLLFTTAAMILIAFAARHFARIYGPDNWRRWLNTQRESGRLYQTAAILTPAFYLLLILVFLAPFGGSILIRLLDHLPMACMFAAMQVLPLSRRPTGDQLRCSRCKYPLEGLEPGPATGPDNRHDARCPECGNHWGRPGGSVKINKRWSPRWIALTAILLLPLIIQLGPAIFGRLQVWEKAVLRIAPTSSLVEEVLTQKSFKMDAWAELGRRKETPEQTNRIATALCSRDANAWFSTEEISWMSSAMLSNTIPQSTVEPRLWSLCSVAIVRTGPALEPRLKSKMPLRSPFEGLDIWVTTVPENAGPESAATFKLDVRRGSVTVSAAPSKPWNDADRFRGAVTVLLQPSGSVPPRIDDSGRVIPMGPAVCRLDKTIDVLVEDSK
ncbi:MAG TPA: hypothetical protein VHC70_08280 [Phycisphaerales bacterium]|nr:hypothetical protein [Phycisphaerales bacterium]